MNEREEYMQKMRELSSIIDKILAEHSHIDRSDLFQIFFALDRSPEERLRKGLRRKVIYGGSHTID